MRWEYFGSGLAFLGIGITMVLALPPPWWPSMPRWMVQSGLVVALALMIYGLAFTIMGIWPDMLRPRLWPIVGLSFGIFVSISSAVWLFQAPVKKITPSQPSQPEQAPLTLPSLFAADFPDTSRFEIGAQLMLSDNRSIEIKAKRFISFASRTKFIGFYVPHSSDTFAICEYLADGYKESLQHMDDTFKVNGQVMGESGMTSSDDLIFSGRVFIYHEDYLSPQQIGALIGLYQSKKLDLKLRSQEYVVNRNLNRDRETKK